MKRIVAALLLSSMALGIQAAQSKPAFRDVPKDHWAAKAVNELKALGLLSGYPDGRFRG